MIYISTFWWFSKNKTTNHNSNPDNFIDNQEQYIYN